MDCHVAARERAVPAVARRRRERDREGVGRPRGPVVDDVDRERRIVVAVLPAAGDLPVRAAARHGRDRRRVKVDSVTRVAIRDVPDRGNRSMRVDGEPAIGSRISMSATVSNHAAALSSEKVGRMLSRRSDWIAF